MTFMFSRSEVTKFDDYLYYHINWFPSSHQFALATQSFIYILETITCLGFLSFHHMVHHLCAFDLLKSEHWEESSSSMVSIRPPYFHKWGLTNQEITKLDQIIISSHYITSRFFCTHHHFATRIEEYIQFIRNDWKTPHGSSSLSTSQCSLFGRIIKLYDMNNFQKEGLKTNNLLN